MWACQWWLPHQGARGLSCAASAATHSAAFHQQAIAALRVAVAGLEARLRLRTGAGQAAHPGPSEPSGPSLGPPDAATLVKAWVGRQVELLSIAAPRKPLATPSNPSQPLAPSDPPLATSYSPL